MPDALVWYSLVALPICVWRWIRLPFTGVKVDGDFAVVTSWWRRRVLLRSSIARFRAESYTGFFFVFGWRVDGRFESGSLEVELKDGTRRRLGGTVCNRRVAREVAESLNRWLGVEGGSGTGPRRMAKLSRAVPAEPCSPAP
ncbi:hypothetical protein RS85_00377 [Microbacterium sp. SA39]|nr:hypothetical protein RS85_00377 [Microbacterium sp. SA39]